MSPPTLRFAPSPNGDLHLGHAYSALLNQQLAGGLGARLLLRIEDIDLTRCTPELEAAMIDDLRWLGIRWEVPVRRQSEHFEDYEAALADLSGRGLVYPAFMSRGEIRADTAAEAARGRPWPRDPDGAPLYPGLDKALSEKARRQRIDAGEPFAWRLDVARAVDVVGDLSWQEANDERLAAFAAVAADPSAWGDVVLARKETPTSYHLSVVVDDALQGVSHVVRGRDLFQATAVQRLLQELLGLPAPLYFHHRLIEGPDGRKLAKSRRDSGLAALRRQGVTPGEVRGRLGFETRSEAGQPGLDQRQQGQRDE
jgi:glutamyl-Q tRNA(Asp) synthetase